MTKCNIERKTKKKKKTKRRLDGEKRRMVQSCTQKMERYRSRGWVDRHLPSSNQQRTTYRCQYDWFGCLFGCAYSAPLLSLSFSFIFGVFFHVLVDCLLRFDGWQRSTKSMKCKCYKVHGPISTTCTAQQTAPHPKQKQFRFVVFHISHTLNLHSRPLCVLFTFTTLSIRLTFLIVFVYFCLCASDVYIFYLRLCHSSSPVGLYYCHLSVDCDITIESNIQYNFQRANRSRVFCALWRR